MSRRTSLILLLLGINVALICGGYTAVWWIFANDLTVEVNSWVEQREGQGLEVEYGEISVEGFPFEIALVFTTPRLSFTETNGSWVWENDQVVLSVKPWRLQQPSIRAYGRQRLKIVQNDGRQGIEISADGSSAQLYFGTFKQLEKLAIDIRGVQAQLISRQDAVTIDRVSIDARRDWRATMPPPLHIIVQAESIVIPAGIVGLGNKVAGLQFYSIIHGSPLSVGSLVPALVSWRDQGGTVEIKKSAIQWSELDIVAEGTFALDETMRPIGAGRAEISGYEDVIKGLVAGKHISIHDGFAAKSLLDGFAQMFPDQSRVSLPIRMQDGDFFLGPLWLTRLHPIIPSTATP